MVVVNDVVTWVALIAACSALVGLAGLWYSMGKSQGETHSAATNATAVAAASSAEVRLLSSQLSEARVEFAKDVARLATSNDFVSRAITELRNEMHALRSELNERLDRIIDKPHH